MHVPMNASATGGANQIMLLEYMPTLLPGCITNSELNSLQGQKLIRWGVMRYHLRFMARILCLPVLYRLQRGSPLEYDRCLFAQMLH